MGCAHGRGQRVHTGAGHKFDGLPGIAQRSRAFDGINAIFSPADRTQFRFHRDISPGMAIVADSFADRNVFFKVKARRINHDAIIPNVRTTLGKFDIPAMIQMQINGD